MTYTVRVNLDGIPLLVEGTFERDCLGIEDLVVESVKIDGLAGREEPAELFDLFDSMHLEQRRIVRLQSGGTETHTSYIRVMDTIEELVAEQIRMG